MPDRVVDAAPVSPLVEYQEPVASLFDIEARETSGCSGPTIGEGSMRPDPRWPFRVVAGAMLEGVDVRVVYGTQNSHGYVSLTEHVDTMVPTFPLEPDPIAELIDLRHIPDCRYETDCTEISLLPRATVVNRGLLRVPRDEHRGEAVHGKLADMLRTLQEMPPTGDLLSPACQELATLVVDRFRSHMLYGDDPLWVAMRAAHPDLPYPPTTEEIYHPRA